MRSARPSTRRSQTMRVASGVTSRGARPVPPVVTTRFAAAAWVRSAPAIRPSSSGKVADSTAPMPAAWSRRQTAGPERSACSPRKHRSLMVSTTARVLGEKLEVTQTVYPGAGKTAPWGPKMRKWRGLCRTVHLAGSAHVRRRATFARSNRQNQQPMPHLETPPNSASPTPPPKVRTGRYGELDEHEIIHLLDALDDERSKARFRESVYISIIIWVAIGWFVLYGPQVIFHQPR